MEVFFFHAILSSVVAPKKGIKGIVGVALLYFLLFAAYCSIKDLVCFVF
jgi:hypothetical protein